MRFALVMLAHVRAAFALSNGTYGTNAKRGGCRRPQSRHCSASRSNMSHAMKLVSAGWISSSILMRRPHWGSTGFVLFAWLS